MSILIHYGPPGSYKTSGAVMDSFIPAVKCRGKNNKKVKPRTIITNVRGLTRESCIKAYPAFNEQMEIINVDTDTPEGMEKISKWFHWAPFGALLILDEAQTIFPKKWTAKDIALLNYPGGLSQAAIDNRPHDWLTAWAKHRHYNWDIVLTTPNIKQIRLDILEPSEGAYKHRNLAQVGVKGRYIEAYHSASETGNASNIITTKTKRITKDVWNYYDSTATGDHQDTQAGISLFSNTRLLLALVLFVPCIAYSISFFTSDQALVKSTQKPVPIEATAKNIKSGFSGDVKALPLDRFDAASISRNKSIALEFPINIEPEPLADMDIDIRGTIKDKKTSKTLYLLAVKRGKTWVELTTRQLYRMGYAIETRGDCMVVLTYKTIKRQVLCGQRSSRYFSSVDRHPQSAQRGSERGTFEGDDSPPSA